MALSEPGKSIPQLMSELVNDVAGLFRSEGRLMRAELSEAGSRLARGAEMMGAGAILLLVALLVLVQALVIALSEWLGPGWASLVVGGLLAVIGAILISKARGDLSVHGLTPEKTMEQSAKDAQLVKEQAR